MIAYHPDSRFLTDFASANLPLSEAVCVSVHLEFCGKCRAHVKQLNELGAMLMESSCVEPLAEDSFDKLMGSIDNSASIEAPAAQHKSPVSEVSDMPLSSKLVSPRALKGALKAGFSKLNWVQLGAHLRIAPLNLGGESRETAIYDIKAGGRMPEHEHNGEEITVLLKGSFSDAEGSYSRGDFVVRNKGEAHQPTATQDMDCVCLVSLESPIKPKSWLYRLFLPYVQHRINRAALY
ncbi:MAG: ChrR family anti-sigma-E factor [Pseudohongiellaceae bacterium]|nr:ChrR family anti-sigma-E factor [Pseudohongiellaceae bacterium]